jgi:hypothetical protein
MIVLVERIGVLLKACHAFTSNPELTNSASTKSFVIINPTIENMIETHAEIFCL